MWRKEKWKWRNFETEWGEIGRYRWRKRAKPRICTWTHRPGREICILFRWATRDELWYRCLSPGTWKTKLKLASRLNYLLELCNYFVHESCVRQFLARLHDSHDGRIDLILTVLVDFLFDFFLLFDYCLDVNLSQTDTTALVGEGRVHNKLFVFDGLNCALFLKIVITQKLSFRFTFSEPDSVFCRILGLSFPPSSDNTFLITSICSSLVTSSISATVHVSHLLKSNRITAWYMVPTSSFLQPCRKSADTTAVPKPWCHFTLRFPCCIL